MDELRIGVIGAGSIGCDHIRRISERMSGARVTQVMDANLDRAEEAIAHVVGAGAHTDLERIVDPSGVDAVMICSPGRFHEVAILAALDARLPIFCEKPLTPDSAAARRVVAAERRLMRPHIQMGFMRRFDSEYAALRALVREDRLGALLMIHAVHRNARPTNPEYTQRNLIDDSVVHEFDVLSWLAGSSVRSVSVRQGRRNSLSSPELREPILVLIELTNGVLVDVEMNVSAQFGYQVTTEAVFERGVARIGGPSGMQIWHQGSMSVSDHVYYDTRFGAAFDREIQAWLDAVRTGGLVAGPNAWDGLRVAMACEAGVEALETGRTVTVPQEDRPGFYR